MNKIKMLKAGYGDTLLITVNSKFEGEINFLVDCGFGYAKEIKPSIESLDKIKRLIITHYDKDHIESAYKLLDENGKSQTPNVVEIEQIWHNTFRHMQSNKYDTIELSDNQNSKLEAYISGNKSEITTDVGEEDIGAKQAINVGSKIFENEYSWNMDFNSSAAIIENKQEVQITKDISIILLSPNKDKLEELENEFKKDIYKLLGIIKIPENQIFDDAFEWFVKRNEYEKMKLEEENISASTEELSISDVERFSDKKLYKPDPSEANGSSIAFILNSENKKILLLGDAHSEIIEMELKKLYPNCVNEPIIFDAIKVSHHGAQGNSSPDLLELIDSDKYLFSTNGKHPRGHKHPDMETIARIVSRPIIEGIEKRKLYFNYELEHIKGFKNNGLKEHFKYEMFVSSEIEI